MLEKFKGMKIRVRALVILSGGIITVILSALIMYSILLKNSFPTEYGLISVFLMALFSHLTIVARGLFLPLFLSLTEHYNLLVLGLAAGLGGGLGEIVAYSWGQGIREILSPEDGRKDPLPKIVERYGLIAILLFAASPLPDTPIMLLAGSLHFPLWKLLSIQIVGKTILYSLGAALGGLLFMELKSFVEEITASIIILVASIILSVLVSWSKSRRWMLHALRKMGINISL